MNVEATQTQQILLHSSNGERLVCRPPLIFPGLYSHRLSLQLTRARWRSQNQSFPGGTTSLGPMPPANSDTQLSQPLTGLRRDIALSALVCDSQKSRQSAARPLGSVEGKVLGACHTRPECCVPHRL